MLLTGVMVNRLSSFKLLCSSSIQHSPGCKEENLFKKKSAGFVSVDRQDHFDPSLGFDSSLQNSPSLYHLRQLANIIGMKCLYSKFDLQPGVHYKSGSDDLDENQASTSTLFLFHAKQVIV